jgi:hypothetical protein
LTKIIETMEERQYSHRIDELNWAKNQELLKSKYKSK